MRPDPTRLLHRFRRRAVLRSCSRGSVGGYPKSIKRGQRSLVCSTEIGDVLLNLHESPEQGIADSTAT